MFEVQSVHEIHQLLISLALGLFIGLQRQWAESPLGGIRTYSFISLFGTLTGLLSQKAGPVPLIAGSIGIIALVSFGNSFQGAKAQQEKKFGLSTEVSMLIMYFIGVSVAMSSLWVAVTSAGAVAIILQSKVELHEFASRFTPKELKSVMQFVLLTVIIFPIIPNKTIDHLGVINPHHIWLMVILVVGLGLAGYTSYKVFGSRAGTLLTGVLGGMISSTATTLNYGRIARVNEQGHREATIIMIAWAMVYVRLLVEIAFAAPRFLSSIAGPLSLMFLILASFSFRSWLKTKNEKTQMVPQENPSELKVAIIFGVLYAGIVFLATYARSKWGEQGFLALAVLSGLTDMDAITLSTANLVNQGRLVENEGVKAIIIASMSNTIFKGLLAYVVGGKSFFSKILVPLTASLVTATVIILFF